ncbi:MAG: hypothetical protein JXM70_26510, partial [Pirellulales bacterium]|nr:hypothetical protein [Pirellulales bacterium]
TGQDSSVPRPGQSTCSPGSPQIATLFRLGNRVATWRSLHGCQFIPSVRSKTRGSASVDLTAAQNRCRK